MAKGIVCLSFYSHSTSKCGMKVLRRARLRTLPFGTKFRCERHQIDCTGHLRSSKHFHVKEMHFNMKSKKTEENVLRVWSSIYYRNVNISAER